VSVGTVVDAKVLATEQVEARATARLCRTSLEALGGAPRGSKVDAWRAWWEANEARLLSARTARRTAVNP